MLKGAGALDASMQKDHCVHALPQGGQVCEKEGAKFRKLTEILTKTPITIGVGRVLVPKYSKQDRITTKLRWEGRIEDGTYRRVKLIGFYRIYHQNMTKCLTCGECL